MGRLARVEQGLVGLASLHRVLYGIANLQNKAIGAVFAADGFALVFPCITYSQFSPDSRQSAHQRLFEALAGVIGCLSTSLALAC